MNFDPSGNVFIELKWTEFKERFAEAAELKFLTTDKIYDMWYPCDRVNYLCVIWRNEVPGGVIAGGYTQAQNDADKLDFETNYKEHAEEL